MPSLEFDKELEEFRAYYNAQQEQFGKARGKLVSMLEDLLSDTKGAEIFSVTGRVKDREEAVAKFTRKYRTGLEASKTPYSIKDYITDLMGLRIVCIYEGDITAVQGVIARELEVLNVTDKTSLLEEEESSFGYRGLHIDARLDESRAKMKEYRSCADLTFEIQIRSLIQDAWSSIDHKIKYKKSISPDLRRRVNALAALFEIAEREFREIRDATLLESLNYQNSYENIEKETEREEAPLVEEASKPAVRLLDAFSFLRIAKHFFPDFLFEDRRVDGFVVEIIEHEPKISPGKFNYYMKTTISRVKRYAEEFHKSKGSSMNAFTIMRHCLFLSDPAAFNAMLTQKVKENFEQWLQAQK